MAKISFTDQRMIELMNYVISNKINAISTKTDFLASIGFSSPTNFAQIKSGAQGFRVEHLIKASEIYNIDGNYFLNKKHLQIFKQSKKNSPMANLKEALRVVEMQLKELTDKTPSNTRSNKNVNK